MYNDESISVEAEPICLLIFPCRFFASRRKYIIRIINGIL